MTPRVQWLCRLVEDDGESFAVLFTGSGDTPAEAAEELVLETRRCELEAAGRRSAAQAALRDVEV